MQPNLIKSFGYPVEEHTVTTQDGYILSLHRIPGSKYGANNTGPKMPVLLGHCMVGSSAIWSFAPNYSLAYTLADQGNTFEFSRHFHHVFKSSFSSHIFCPDYDVWMINVRGNTYSRKHVFLDPSADAAFWNFSHHESAIYDYAATIDHILNKTGQPDMYFAGYSMGTAQYLILLSEKPEYNSKIRAGFLMGPAAIGKHATNPLVAGSPYAEHMKWVVNSLGIYEIVTNMKEIQAFFTQLLCDSGSYQRIVCSYIFAAAVGMEPGSIDPDMIPAIMTHMPAGVSTKTMTHLAQMFRNGEHFSKYDHGREGNLKVYGTPHPERYNLKNVIVPTALIGGDRDGFAGEKDLEILASQLPNVLFNNQVDFGHLDFIFGSGVHHQINLPIVEKMNQMRFKNCCV